MINFGRFKQKQYEKQRKRNWSGKLCLAATPYSLPVRKPAPYNSHPNSNHQEGKNKKCTEPLPDSSIPQYSDLHSPKPFLSLA